MSFNFINGIAPDPICLSKPKKKEKVVENSIDPNNPNKDMNIALENLKKNIIQKYKEWGGFNKEFNINFKNGKKFIKVLEQTIAGKQSGRVWGFVAMADGVHKNIPYKRGDTFKPASWASPAKWSRGNIFYEKTDWYCWTGPNYLK